MCTNFVQTQLNEDGLDIEDLKKNTIYSEKEINNFIDYSFNRDYELERYKEAISIMNEVSKYHPNNFDVYYKIYDDYDNYGCIGNTFDVFIFFSVDYNGPGTGANYNLDINDNQYYSQHSIVWLLSVLDKYRNHRCFVFTHLFFPEKAGNNTSGKHYNYALGRGNYVLAGNNFEILNFANNYYKNAIWFTGHSHYKWMWAKIDNKINVCKYDPIEQCESAWNVHLPSLSRPLGLADWYYVKGEDSEAAIMDVYENYVDIRGIEMKTDEVTKYFGITDLDFDDYFNCKIKGEIINEEINEIISLFDYEKFDKYFEKYVRIELREGNLYGN